MATKARKSAKKKSARSGKKRGAARKSSGRRASARKGASKRKAAGTKRRSSSGGGRKQSPVSRVKRVTREVVQQASDAVSAGVETLKDLGENLVDRYRT